MATDGRTRVIILGAAGTGLLMAETVDRVPALQFAGFLDDDARKRSDGYGGYPVLGALGDWESLPQSVVFLTALYGAKRQRIFCERVESLKIPDSRWICVSDPAAVVSPRAIIGPGSFIAAGSIVEPMVAMGRRCALLGNVYLAHHVQLEDHVACANCASIAGGVRVGAGAYVGANATIREYTQIGQHAVVGMSSCVLQDVADFERVAGNPARPLAAMDEDSQ